MVGGGVDRRKPLEKQVRNLHRDTTYRINHLMSIRERLSIIPEDASPTHVITLLQERPMNPSNKVFVVHGHDELAKQSVARFIEKLGLQAIILHEQTNQGKTIIEKFEAQSDVGFAVILLTPDDVGASKAAHAAGQALNERARQNVVFEHGFLIGRFGREKVCALHKGVETPSDLQGVIYIPLDDAGTWRLSLAREMKDAGMNVDLNRAY